MKRLYFILLSSFLIATPALAESLPNPLAHGESKFIPPEDLVARLVKMILGLTGVLAIVMFMYGAVVISTSAGIDARIKKGKNIIFWAAIGIVVTFSAYAIVNTFLKVITF